MSLQDLEAQALAAEKAASEEKLSDDEAKAAALVERITKANEARATAARARRTTDRARREAAARAKAPPRVLVKGIDLLDLFPVGVTPDPKTLPGDGVIIVRSPPPQKVKEVHAAVEHNREQIADIYAALLCESVSDPDVDADKDQGTKLAAFCEAYPNAAMAAGTIVLRLGGSRIQAEKRGHG